MICSGHWVGLNLSINRHILHTFVSRDNITSYRLRNIKNKLDLPQWGGGGGGGRPEEKGAGGVREAGEEGAGSGIPKVAGSGTKREKFCNIVQYFAFEKMRRGGSQKIKGGNRDCNEFNTLPTVSLKSSFSM